jgi:NAD(P)-dependent dehydrogenase (short-subunit alcohol dehydrogenase family)
MHVSRQTPWSGLGVFVSGGAAGIGLSLGRIAAERGAGVVLADIEEGVAEQAAASLRADGARAFGLRCDVTDYDEVTQAIEQSVEKLGQLNLICANAGVGLSATLENTSVADFAWVMEVNVYGVFAVARAGAAYLRVAAASGQRAHILVTGSENSLGLPAHVPAMTAYQTSKYALLGLTDCMRRDLAPSGVDVTILCPSYVATEGWNARRSRPPRFGGPQQADPAFRQALHQIGQDPDEVARMAYAGIDRGDEIIVTSPVSKACADVRAAQVERAFAQLAESSEPSAAVSSGGQA